MERRASRQDGRPATRIPPGQAKPGAGLGQRGQGSRYIEVLRRLARPKLHGIGARQTLQRRVAPYVPSTPLPLRPLVRRLLPLLLRFVLLLLLLLVLLLPFLNVLLLLPPPPVLFPASAPTGAPAHHLRPCGAKHRHQRRTSRENRGLVPGPAERQKTRTRQGGASEQTRWPAAAQRPYLGGTVRVCRGVW